METERHRLRFDQHFAESMISSENVLFFVKLYDGLSSLKMLQKCTTVKGVKNDLSKSKNGRVIFEIHRLPPYIPVTWQHFVFPGAHPPGGRCLLFSLIKSHNPI